MEDALTYESRLLGAAHIAVRARVLPDGRLAPVALHDRTLGQDCVPTRMDDGTFRCTTRLDWACRETQLGPSFTKSALVDTSSAKDKCHGGVVWLPGRPASPATRFGIGPHGPEPAIPGRAVRFATTARMSDEPNQMFAPGVKRLVWDQLEELPATVFPELRILQDP